MGHIIHLRKECIGCSVCVMMAPKYWQMSANDGKADLIGGIEKNNTWVREARPDELDDNTDAAKNCPVNIIRLVDDAGHQL